MKKVGLLLGSFDPVHIAHVNVAACAINSGKCSRVLFVVAKHNPWKKEAPAPFNLRCKMVEAAIEPLGDKAEVCRLEGGIEPPTYSYKVLTLIREQHPDDELYILAGTDTFDKLPGWKNWKTDIEPYFKVICVDRNLANPKDVGLEKNKAFVVGSLGCLIGQVDKITPRILDVSSTMIRNMVANGQNPYPLVTKEVLQIINDNNLYRQ